jgi:hypothetical protein
MGSDADYNGGVVLEQGGQVLRVKAGATLAFDAGASLDASALGIYALPIVGNNGAGACTAEGTEVGDQLLAIFGAPTAGGAMLVKVPGTDFEATVSVANELQQRAATNLSADTFVGLFVPAPAA